MAKLKSELDVVQQNCKVFSEMLTEMTPGQENSSDLELLLVSGYIYSQGSKFGFIRGGPMFQRMGA